MSVAQRSGREVLEIYRTNRTSEQEIALIDFFELSEQERWELLFFGTIDAWHMANIAMGNRAAGQ